MLAHFVGGFGVDERAKVGALFKAVANLHLAHPVLQLGRECVIDACLHIDPVGADTGLAVVAELAHDGTLDRRIEIGVVKDDERRVAAQFHGAFHHLIGSLLQQDAPHFGGAGEGQLAHGGVLAELLAHGRRRRRRQHVEHTRRDARTFCQHTHDDGRQRGFCRRTRDERTARRQRRSRLAGDHSVGEVPRRDRSCHTDGLLHHHDAFVALVAGDHLAVDALGLFAEEFDEGRAIGDLALGFGQRFALFGGEDGAQIVLVLHHQVEPFAHHGGAFLAGPSGPVLLRLFSLGNSARNLCAAEVSDLRDDIAPRGVGHVECAVVAINPLATDIGACFQQAGVFE